MSNADRVLGQLVVEAGILSAPQIESFLAEIDAGRRAPGSLLPLLVQSGRIPQSQVAQLQQQVQQRLSTSPSDSQSSDLQRLISVGVLDAQRAAHVSQALANWRQQGRAVSVREAVLHFQLASPQQLDQVLAPPSFANSLVNTKGPGDEDAGKRTEVLSFQRNNFFGGSSEFVSPVSNPQNNSFANSTTLPAAGQPPAPLAPSAGNNVFSPFSSRAEASVEQAAPAAFKPLAAAPQASPHSQPSGFNPMAGGGIGGSPSGPVASPFGASPFSSPANASPIASPFASAAPGPSFSPPSSPFQNATPTPPGPPRSPFAGPTPTRSDR